MTAKPNRSDTVAILVRCTPEEKALLEAACRELCRDAPGAKLATSKWMLGLALATAADVLGEWPPGEKGKQK